jgi:redox-sensitive bicupin YhaK (pirin superfamily)
MLDGHMQHKDNFGNTGDLGPGSVQWMTAARGIIHSEMPQQSAGRMRGFQLWLNLPAKEKMQPASYRDIPAGEIPTVALPGGGAVRVIAGALEIDGRRAQGPVNGARDRTTDPLYVDVHLPANATFRAPIARGHNAFLYAYEGSAAIGGKALPHRAAGLLSDGDEVAIAAGPDGGRFLLLAAKPLREPVVQYGPFVMNTRNEIDEAIYEYNMGTLALTADEIRKLETDRSRRA